MSTYIAHGRFIHVSQSMHETHGIFDFMATEDGTEEDGWIGWGRTEIAAVNDLLALLDLDDIDELEEVLD